MPVLEPTFLGMGIGAWVGIAVSSVLSIPIAWFFWFLPHRRLKGGLHQLTGDVGGVGAPAIAELAARLQFLYDDKIVRSVTVTSVGIWNSGPNSIKHDQLSRLNPLRIEVGEAGQMLSATITAVSQAHIGAIVTPNLDTNTAILDFEFLDEMDGFVVQLIHTAGAFGARLTGHIIGQGEGGVIAFEDPAPRLVLNAVVPAIITVGLTAIVAATFSSTRWLEIEPNTRMAVAALIAFGFFGIILFRFDPDRALNRLPKVVRESPGLVAAAWPRYD